MDNTSLCGPANTRVETGKIQADDGAELYYERRGSGPHSLLIIPGALGSISALFSAQLDYFGSKSSEFTVVGFDPRGYGNSRPYTRDYSAPDIYHRDAHDAVQVMAALGHSKFSVIGWCEGGIRGIVTATFFPECVQKLIVWGCRTYVTKDDVEMIEKVRDTNKWSTGIRAATEIFYGEEYSRLWSNWMDGFVGVHFDPIRKGDLCVREVKEVKCPTLVLHGMKDRLCPAFHAEYLAKNIKNCRLVTWSEGKHWIHLQYPMEFNKLVHDFLIE